MPRVLLVEDEPLVRMAAEDDLTELGYDVVAAETGDAAFSIVAGGEHFDILVTDIRMPGILDGWTLAERAREILPDLGVLYMSGFPGTMSNPLPGSVFLKKPYRLAQLKEAMETISLSG